MNLTSESIWPQEWPQQWAINLAKKSISPQNLFDYTSYWGTAHCTYYSTSERSSKVNAKGQFYTSLYKDLPGGGVGLKRGPTSGGWGRSRRPHGRWSWCRWKTGPGPPAAGSEEVKQKMQLSLKSILLVITGWAMIRLLIFLYDGRCWLRQYHRHSSKADRAKRLPAYCLNSDWNSGLRWQI